MLLQFVIQRRWLAIDHNHAPFQFSLRIHGQYDAVSELFIQIFIEKVDRLHNVHVAVDKTQSIFHGRILRVGISSTVTNPSGRTESPAGALLFLFKLMVARLSKAASSGPSTGVSAVPVITLETALTRVGVGVMVIGFIVV